MKKQIALLATIIAASGLTAFGQDWISFQDTSKTTWNLFSGSPNTFASGGDIDAVILWAPTGTADALSGVAGTGTGQGYGLRAGAANDQVATNATSVGSVNPVSEINSMLSSGWVMATNINSGTGSAATGLAIASDSASLGLAVGQVGFDGGVPFEIAGGTGVSGSSIEMVILAYNASAGSWSTASALGWSNPFSDVVGSSASDSNAQQEGSPLVNQFGVAAVPEPATLALAGLGGLSMLFLRRRKS